MIKRGVIPAAGAGERLRPFTLAFPKELLPVGDKAVIEHGVEAMVQADIRDITVIVGWRKHAILDYLGSGSRLGVNITYLVQDEEKGLAKAIERAKTVIDEPFLVILGDNYLKPKSFAGEIVKFHEKEGSDCTIGVCRVNEPQKFGIIEVEGSRAVRAVEKPKKSESDLGIAGIYVFEPSIFETIKRLKPGKNGEYQLTDAIQLMISDGKKVLVKELLGTHIDVGTFEALRKLQGCPR